MTRDPNPLPQFVRDALAEEPALDVEPVLRLPELFEPAPSAAGLLRLMEAVSEPPGRYAPFIARLSALWDLSEDDVSRVLERSAARGAFRRTGLPGVRLMNIQGGPKTAAAYVSLVRFSPGLRFPEHRHPGPEISFVLEGSYTDSAGRFVGPGDVHEMAAGTRHAFVVGKDGPCILAVVQVGLEFTGPLMRLMSKIFPR